MGRRYQNAWAVVQWCAEIREGFPEKVQRSMACGSHLLRAIRERPGTQKTPAGRICLIPNGGRCRSLSVAPGCPIREASRTLRAEFRGHGAGFITNLADASFPRAYDDGEGRLRGGQSRGGDAGRPASTGGYREWGSLRKSCARVGNSVDRFLSGRAEWSSGVDPVAAKSLHVSL